MDKYIIPEKCLGNGQISIIPKISEDQLKELKLQNLIHEFAIKLQNRGGSFRECFLLESILNWRVPNDSHYPSQF